MSESLFDQIRSFEEYLAGRQAELRRYEEQLDAIERTRAEFSRQVENDHGNAEARREMEKADLAISDQKKKIANHLRWTRSRAQNMRAKILHTQERTLTELNAEIERKQSALNELRTVLIPEAELHVARLHERIGRVEGEISDVQKEIQRINKLNMDVLFSD